MGVFERIGRVGASPGAIAPASEQDALRLIDEGNAFEDGGRLEQAAQSYDAAIRTAPTLARGHINRGNVLLKIGDTDGALASYATALACDPNHAGAHYNMGNAYLRSGRREAAVGAYRKAIELKPDFADAEVALGCVLEDLGRIDVAVASYRRALEIRPDYAEVHGNLANALRALGQVDAALASYRRALEIKPDLVAVHYGLAETLHDLRRYDDAEASCRYALQLAPDFAQAHWKLGAALHRQGRFDEAVESYRRALALKANSAGVHFDLGNALREIGRRDEAEASYRHALAIDPNCAEVYCNLGNILSESERMEEAVASYHRALEIAPDFAIVHTNLGNALRDLARPDQALASYRRAAELKPDLATTHFNVGNALRDLGRLDEVIANYRRALEIDPRHPETHNNLGTALHERGEIEPALASYRCALALNPDYPVAFSNLLFCLSHSEAISPEALFEEHLRFGERFEAPVRGEWPRHRNARDPERPLRVGFVSADLRNHAVAYFLEPLLKHLSASPALILHGYHSHVLQDHVTTRIRACFQHWNRVKRLSDAELAQKIGKDKIDILIDLSGHTADNRLPTFARKPAPVQASWVGYPGTTGLRAMDYYINDSFLLPPGRFDDQFVEKLVQLPASAPFMPDDAAPAVNPLPALTNGYVTFGSFNRPNKLSAAVLDLWSGLLRDLPDARLMLCAIPVDGKFDGLIDGFEQRAIGRERLRFHARCDMATYLKLHHQIDICLDTYPYTGSTTTNHALWMGVPTLTLAGRTPPGRQGAAVLGRVGLEAFVASDAADFRTKGLRWARDIDGLAQVRATLRQRCGQSVTRRPDLIATALEQALRTMWRLWCAGERPRTFSIKP